MRDKQLQATRDQIELAVKLSSEKFLSQKKASNETIIISQNGVIKEVNATDIK